MEDIFRVSFVVRYIHAYTYGLRVKLHGDVKLVEIEAFAKKMEDKPPSGKRFKNVNWSTVEVEMFTPCVNNFH